MNFSHRGIELLSLSYVGQVGNCARLRLKSQDVYIELFGIG